MGGGGEGGGRLVLAPMTHTCGVAYGWTGGLEWCGLGGMGWSGVIVRAHEVTFVPLS